MSSKNASLSSKTTIRKSPINKSARSSKFANSARSPPRQNIKTVIVDKNDPIETDERLLKNRTDEDYLEGGSISSYDNNQYNIDVTKSRKTPGYFNASEMNLEEIFEFEKQQQRINTEKVVTSWTDKREELVDIWIKELEFYQVISYFYLFQVKKIENTWAWLIIVLSAIVSTISLIQFDKDEDDATLVLVINILVTVFTTFITLIAAWMKKQNYVSTISEVDKYLQSLSIVLSELNGQIKIAREDRDEFCNFLDKYKDKVINFSSSMPLISPYDWKHTVYLLTKYYPELVQDTYPWNENKDFSKLILMTYHNVKYRTCFRRLISGYYCYSSCCKSEEENVRNIKDYFHKIKKIEEDEFLNEIEEKYNNIKNKKNLRNNQHLPQKDDVRVDMNYRESKVKNMSQTVL